MLLTNQKSWDEYQQDVRDFNAVRAENGWEPKQPTVAVNVVCAQTESEAWDRIVRHTTEAQISVETHYHFSDAAHFKQAEGYKFYEAFAKTLTTKSPEELGEFNAKPQAFGTTEQVLAKIKAIQAKTGAEEIICNFRMGGVPAADAEASMRLFAAEVLPALHELDAKLPVEMAGTA